MSSLPRCRMSQKGFSKAAQIAADPVNACKAEYYNEKRTAGVLWDILFHGRLSSVPSSPAIDVIDELDFVTFPCSLRFYLGLRKIRSLPTNLESWATTGSRF